MTTRTLNQILDDAYHQGTTEALDAEFQLIAKDDPDFVKEARHLLSSISNINDRRCVITARRRQFLQKVLGGK